MPSSNHSLYHMTKLSTVFATLLCVLCMGLNTLPVHAQAPSNGRRIWVKGNSVNYASPTVPTQSAERVSVAEAPTASGESQTAEQCSHCVIESQKNDLVGSWLITVVASDGASFKSLQTFTADGNIIGADQGDISTANPPFFSANHGVWAHQGARQFAWTFLKILYDPEGNFAGIAKVRANFTLGASGDELSGRAVFVDSDPDGNVVASGSATFQGNRIKLEPLN